MTRTALIIAALAGAATMTAPATAMRSQEDIAALDATALAAEMARGTLTSEAVTAAYLARIAAIDQTGPTINAVLAVMPDALDQARARDAERRAGRVLGPLHGVPILIKDNIETREAVATTAGSLALAGNITRRDAPVVARLRAAGAVILGKANLSEWANIRSGNSTSGWSAVGGLTRNPHATDRNACGSSSGSGAGMAAGLAAATIGTETDGSITCPAGMNGVVGFKPTVGLVSRTHIVPISASQDTAGPMTASVRDAALLLTVMAGTDAADPPTGEADRRRADYVAALDPQFLRGKRIGVLRDRIGNRAPVTALFEASLTRLRDAGAVIIDVQDSRAGLEELGNAEFEVLLTELKAGMADYLGSLPGTGLPRTLADVIAFNRANADRELRWFDQGTFELAEAKGGLDSPAYIKARDTARRLAREQGIDRIMGAHQLDLIVGVSNGPSWVTDLVNGDSFAGPSSSQLPAVAGYPHISVPMGTIHGLPVGISFFGRQWDDARVLAAGAAWESIAPARAKPSLRPWSGEAATDQPE